DEVHDQLERVTNSLRDYPAFWRGWARSLPPQQRDLAVFLMLVSSNLSGNIIKWTDVVFEGIGTLADRLVGAPLPPPSDCPTPSYLPRSETSRPETSRLETSWTEASRTSRGASESARPGMASFRTKTMADLLASQGDVEGALEIYRELLHSTVSDERRTELSARIAEFEARRAEAPEPHKREDAFGVHAKNRLISTLETLAARFEARVQN
ncbi:MAG: tetratricopeptide repeat protein, partial [Proteobacteria bacterium]|nr:tetratricopeptide repeat protein [Pseudomonadota bacterium]